MDTKYNKVTIRKALSKALSKYMNLIMEECPDKRQQIGYHKLGLRLLHLIIDELGINKEEMIKTIEMEENA